jgi:hypothetical protein
MMIASRPKVCFLTTWQHHSQKLRIAFDHTTWYNIPDDITLY